MTFRHENKNENENKTTSQNNFAVLVSLVTVADKDGFSFGND
jgi:hypothetical protein